MRGPYGFEMNENCQTCRFRKAGFFCQTSPEAIKGLDSLKSVSAYPEGAVLFIEKQEARGVFLLCDGEVKLTICSSEGKTLILRIARPGEVLGLMATMSGKPYEVTAETLRPSHVAFVRRADFLRLLSQSPEFLQGVVRQLAANYHGACEQLRTVGLAASAPEKLARMLLEWSQGAVQTGAGSRIALPLTHEQIAEFIGISRETVTRTLSDFRSRQFVTLKGSTLTIANRAALEQIVGA